jgi:hypothetical protein
MERQGHFTAPAKRLRAEQPPAARRNGDLTDSFVPATEGRPTTEQPSRRDRRPAAPEGRRHADQVHQRARPLAGPGGHPRSRDAARGPGTRAPRRGQIETRFRPPVLVTGRRRAKPDAARDGPRPHAQEQPFRRTADPGALRHARPTSATSVPRLSGADGPPAGPLLAVRDGLARNRAVAPDAAGPARRGGHAASRAGPRGRGALSLGPQTGHRDRCGSCSCSTRSSS